MHLRRFPYALGLPVLAAALTVICCGCTSQVGPQWLRTAIWGKPDVDPTGAPSPAERLAKLRELREEVPTLGGAQQNAKAAELAQRYHSEPDPLLRAQVVRTIALCGSHAAGETLAAAAKDPNHDVRIAACDAWAEHGGPQAVPMLSEVLRHDPSNDVRMAAARALGKMQGPEVVSALAPALDDRDPALQYRAVQSLRTATGKDFGDDVQSWREYVQGGTPEEISTAQRMKLDYF